MKTIGITNGGSAIVEICGHDARTLQRLCDGLSAVCAMIQAATPTTQTTEGMETIVRDHGRGVGIEQKAAKGAKRPPLRTNYHCVKVCVDCREKYAATSNAQERCVKCGKERNKQDRARYRSKHSKKSLRPTAAVQPTLIDRTDRLEAIRQAAEKLRAEDNGE